jgi:hypothetical protein
MNTSNASGVAGMHFRAQRSNALARFRPLQLPRGGLTNFIHEHSLQRASFTNGGSLFEASMARIASVAPITICRGAAIIATSRRRRLGMDDRARRHCAATHIFQTKSNLDPLAPSQPPISENACGVYFVG